MINTYLGGEVWKNKLMEYVLYSERCVFSYVHTFELSF